MASAGSEPLALDMVLSEMSIDGKNNPNSFTAMMALASSQAQDLASGLAMLNAQRIPVTWKSEEGPGWGLRREFAPWQHSPQPAEVVREGAHSRTGKAGQGLLC